MAITKSTHLPLTTTYFKFADEKQIHREKNRAKASAISKQFLSNAAVYSRNTEHAHFTNVFPFISVFAFDGCFVLSAFLN